MKVRLLSHGPMRGRYNMAVDEAIQKEASKQIGSGPTLRFYQWKPACLSLGRFQDPAAEIDLHAVNNMSIDLVRRPTGGKAVLHDNELTYSIVIAEKDLPGTILETYQKLSKAIVFGIRALGIKADLMSLEHGVTARDTRFQRAACFTAPSWYEIVSEGRKITGSAQVRKDGFILQHGSIPLSMDYSKQARCLKTKSEKHRVRIESMLKKKSAGLSQVRGADVTRFELESALVQAFRYVLNWEIDAGTLSPNELTEALKLSQGKYGDGSWTMERSRLSDDLY